MSIGSKIKRLRLRKGLTQEELGKYLGIGKAAVQKYESGQVQNLKSSHIKILCSLFDVKPWIFIYDDDFSIEQKNTEYELLTSIKTVLGEHGYNSFCLMLKLNETGLKKVETCLKDIVRIEEYQKNKRP